MRKPAFFICENINGNREADQRLCFRYTDITIPLLPKSEISKLQPCSEAVQPGLCRTKSDTPKIGFSHNEAHISKSIKYQAYHNKFKPMSGKTNELI